MRGPVSGCSCRRWEERSLGACLVGGLVHLVLDVSWLANRVSELDNEVVVQVVLIWRLRLFSNSGTDDFTFDTLCSVRCSCS